MNKERFADKNERWVCPCCGRTSEPGGDRYNIGDTACVLWAVLCHAEKVNGQWHAVGEKDRAANDNTL